MLPSLWVSESSQFVHDAAGAIAVEIERCIALRRRCRLALAGGGTPRPIYEALARSPTLDVESVEFLWSDERAVGPTDASSNYRMAREAWLDRVGVSEAQCLPVHGERTPSDARAMFERDLGQQPIDVLLLGMGADGHTASLFPGDDASSDIQARVIVTNSPVSPTTRISLSLRAINEARVVLVLVAGASKSERIIDVWRQIEAGSPQLPLAAVCPQGGALHWLLDKPAAQHLPEQRFQDPKRYA